MKRNKLKVTILSGVLTMMLFLVIAYAKAGSFGTHGWYSSAYWVTQIPLINDEVNGNSGCKTSCATPINNYMYVKVRIGASSSTYTQKTKSATDTDHCGTIRAYWDKSHYAQTYHKATCHTHEITETKTLNYSN